jgi:RecJ-like exonuclease
MSYTCLSHKGDLDGLVSGAFAKLAFGAEVVLVGYAELEPQLRKFDGERLIIADLGLYGPRFKTYLSLLPERRFIYLDHHSLPSYAKRALAERGGEVVHSTRDCTSVLFYHRYRDRLPPQAGRLAAIAALSDYMEAGPLARRLIEGMERFTLFLEASLYTLAILALEKKTKRLMQIVDALAGLRPAHELSDVVEEALSFAHRIDELRSRLLQESKAYRRLLVVRGDGNNTGLLASLALELGTRPIAAAVRRSGDEAKLSLRAKRLPGLHLGRLVAKLAGELEGDGGGHALAAGARVKWTALETFLKKLDEELMPYAAPGQERG